MRTQQVFGLDGTLENHLHLILGAWESTRMNHTAGTARNDLTVYMHDDPAAFRFQLFGDLSGRAVSNLEQAWRTASSVIRDRCLVVDLSALTGIDRAGRDLLARWHTAGARLIIVRFDAKQRVESMIDCPVAFEGQMPKPSLWRALCNSTRRWTGLPAMRFPAARRKAHGNG